MEQPNRLTDSFIRALKPSGKSRKFFDGDGMFLLQTPSGALGWRLKYRIAGREKLISFGSYPEVRLAEARDLRHDARKLIAKGTDPSEVRKAAKLAASNSFAQVAEEYVQQQEGNLAKRTVDKARWQLREFVNPMIGNKPINSISAQELLALLRRIEARGKTETTYKTKELCGRVFLYGVATGRCERNIAADLKGALKPRAGRSYPAIVDPAKVSELLRAVDGYIGQPATVAALRLLPHVFLRGGELRQGKWSEIDWDNAQWRIPAERMKMKREHIVPLSRQSIAILRGLKKITGDGEWMFPALGPKKRCISENTLGAALRTLGYGPDLMVPHGFRVMASTLLHDMGFVSSDIELQLAHSDKNKIRAIYNRSERIKERARMMQKWSDRLDALKAAKVNRMA
jgi:integrase